MTDASPHISDSLAPAARDDAARPFPLAQTAAWIVGTAVLVGGTAATVAHGSGRVGEEGVRAIWHMTIAVGLISVVSLWPIALAARIDMLRVALAQVAGSGLRIMLCGMAAAVAVLVLNAPAGPVAFGTAAVYLPVSIVEAVCVSRYTRRHAAPSTEAAL